MTRGSRGMAQPGVSPVRRISPSSAAKNARIAPHDLVRCLVPGVRRLIAVQACELSLKLRGPEETGVSANQRRLQAVNEATCVVLITSATVRHRRTVRFCSLILMTNDLAAVLL